MDVVLELFDAFLFDRLYAALLPLPKSFLSQDGGASKVALPAVTGWQYQPASQYMSFKPSKWAYLSNWPRDDPYRQTFSLFLITWVFGIVLYFVVAGLSYMFVFDKSAFQHPKYIKNQIRLEIKQAMKAMPGIAALTAPCFLLEVRGYSKMYDTTADGPGLWYNFLQFPLFIAFTDMFIYWIHRGLHHPSIYKALHKPHHKWIMPTPFASHAFHPVDGFAQGIPYHVYPFIFPLQKHAYVLLFVLINIWTVMIHDGEYVSQSVVVNGAACHTMHHLYFNYNYGQFTTLWDRIGGSYRKPNEELFRRDAKTNKQEWEKQKWETEKMVMEGEGEDDRAYGLEGKKAQ